MQAPFSFFRLLAAQLLLSFPLLAGAQAADTLRSLYAPPARAQHAAKTTALKSRIIGSATYFVLPGPSDTAWCRDSTASRYAPARLSGIPDTFLHFFRQAPADTFALYSRSIERYNAANFRTEQYSQTRSGNTWTYSQYRFRYAPDGLGTDTLEMTDTFSTATGQYRPYSELRAAYLASDPVKPLFQIFSYWNTDSAAYVVNSVSRWSYNSAGSLTGSMRLSGFNGKPNASNGSRDTLVYNPGNKPLTRVFQDLRKGAWVSTDSQSYSYDAANREVLKVHYSTSLSSTPLHQLNLDYTDYDARGNRQTRLDSSFDAATRAFKSVTRYSYGYDAVDSLVSIRTDYKTRVSGTSDSLRIEYDASGRRTLWTEYALLQGRWYAGSQHGWGYSANGDADSAVYRIGNAASDTLKNVSLEIFNYDSLDRISRFRRYYWQDTAWSLWSNGFDRRYYYEMYNDSPVLVSVPRVPVLAGAELKLYPVPAAEEIRLELRLAQRGGFEAAIINTAGQVLRSWKDVGEGSFGRRVPVGDLASGIYYLRIRSADGITTARFVVRH